MVIYLAVDGYDMAGALVDYRAAAHSLVQVSVTNDEESVVGSWNELEAD